MKRNLLDEDQAKFGTDFDPNANMCVRCMEDDGDDDGSGSDEDSEQLPPADDRMTGRTINRMNE